MEDTKCTEIQKGKRQRFLPAFPLSRSLFPIAWLASLPNSWERDGGCNSVARTQVDGVTQDADSCGDAEGRPLPGDDGLRPHGEILNKEEIQAIYLLCQTLDLCTGGHRDIRVANLSNFRKHVADCFVILLATRHT